MQSGVRSVLLFAALLGIASPARGQNADTAVHEDSPTHFSQLLKDTLGDFKKLPSRRTFTWLTIGAGAAAISHPADGPVTRTLSRPNTLHEIFETGGVIGNPAVQAGGAFAVYAVGRVTHSSETVEVGEDLLQAQALSQAMSLPVKIVTGRTRPDGGSFSFPSAHAASMFATATVLERHFGWKAGVPAYAVASYVATSRIQARHHYLSDVVFGATIGVISGRVLKIVRR
jgi:hypothetical protein